MLGLNYASFSQMGNNNILRRVNSMKEKLILIAILIATAVPAWAGIDDIQDLPEPSTLGLFAAAAIAITILAKLKK